MLGLPVVVLCGGLGTRLRIAVADRPKALATVGESSFLAMQLELLRDRGARQFVLCVGHKAEQIEAAFGDGSASVCESTTRATARSSSGTGGA